MKSVYEVEILLFFNRFQHNTVNVSMIYTNLIVLFADTIYNIYNIYWAKNIFNGLYDGEKSSRKTGNRSTPNTGTFRIGQKLKYTIFI